MSYVDLLLARARKEKAERRNGELRRRLLAREAGETLHILASSRGLNVEERLRKERVLTH